MPSKLNREWHLANPLSKNPSIEDGIRWHLAHREACACREMPESVRAEVEKRAAATGESERVE